MKYFTPLLLALLLSACGGGGSSAPAVDPTPAPAPPPSPALLLGASSMAQTMTAGTSIAMTVNATATRPADFTGVAEVFTKIVDDAGVIVPNAGLTRNGDQYTATLFSSPSLVPGGYKGNLLIKLCRDAACATQFPGSPVNLPYDLTVVAGELVPIKLYPNSSLTTSLRLGAVTSFKTAVAVAAPGRTWTVTSSAAWLTVANASGSGNGSFDASIDASGLTAGSYAAVVDLKASDGQHVSLPATLTVLPTAFQIYGNNLTFNAINGAPISSQALQFTLDNSTPTAWSASSSADWIKLTPLSGTTPATATMSIDPSKLAQGSYNANLVLSSPVSTPANVAVTLNLAPATLGLSPSALTLGGANGRDFSAQPVAISLNTQTNSYPWTATAAAPLQLSAASGNASQTSTTLTVSATAQSAPVGTSSAAMTLVAKVNGDTITKQLPVTINKDQRKLLATETGVAFSSTPSWSRLSRTIKISDNFGLDAGWSATSNKSWLSVTASGRTVGGAGTLSLSADPSSLPLNQISYATVTLSSADASVTAPETIQVALWKGSVTPTAQAKAALHYTTLIADPIRPLVYVHDSASSLDVYNVYTGAKVATIASLGASLASMAVSPNGDTLYVFDTANRTIVVVDLATLSKTGTWAMPVMATASSRMVAMHPNGVNVVLTNGNGSFLAPTGASLGASFATGEMAASGDGRRLFSDGGSAFSIDFTAINGGTLLASRYATSYYGSGGDFASNLDGSRFYTSGSYGTRCGVLSGDNASQIGSLPGGDNSYYSINVEVASDGRVFCGNGNYYGVADLWVHRADGTLQTSLKVAGAGRTLQTRQLVISGDALMVAGLTDEPTLVFMPVGP